MGTAASPAGLFPINFERVTESLTILADDVEYLANASAEGKWSDRSERAGRQIIRLRLLLNGGNLDLADCDDRTLEILRSAWILIGFLEFDPARFQRRLFLPPDTLLKLANKFGVPELIEQRDWAWFSNDLRLYAAILSNQWGDADSVSSTHAVATERESPPSRLTPRGTDEIPPEYRTRAMSKKDAARYLGMPNHDSGVKWLNSCIQDGTIKCETLTPKTHVFDRRQFPPNAHDAILPQDRKTANRR